MRSLILKKTIVTGIKGGLNLTNLSDGKNTQEMKPSFHVGGLVELPLSYYKKFALQVEMQYSNQGYKGKETEIRHETTGKVIGKNKLDDVTLHFLNVPIMIKYYSKDNFAIEVGPQIGFLVKAKGTGDGVSTSVVSGNNSDNKDNFESFDFSIGAGLAYDLENGFFVNARYNFGLTDVVKENEGKSVNNGVIQVGVGYKF